MDRNLVDVINEMLKCTPTMDVELVHELNRIKTSLSYAPPEGQYLWWRETQRALINAYGDDYNMLLDEQRKVVDIFTAKVKTNA